MQSERREKIKDRLNRLAAEFYLCMGYKVRDSFDFTQSNHPQEKMCYHMAEIAYEEFTGDRPDYAEDEDDEDEECEDYEEFESSETQGCLFPGRCIMVGTHLTQECITAEEMEDYYNNLEQDS